MSRQLWMEPLINSGEDGTALANSTTPTSLLPSFRKFTLPSYCFDALGQTLKIRASGRISNIVTTPGTLTLDIMFGSIAAFTSGAMALNIVAKTDVHWLLELDMVMRTLGASTSALMMGQGRFESHSVIGAPAPSAGGCGVHLLPYNAAPAVGSGFDGTSSQTIDLRGTWSIANAGNSIQCHSFSVVSMN